MGEPHEDHPHGTPPGQDPAFVPPGHGGTPPGQEQPEAPETPTHPEVPPPGAPSHPAVPPPGTPTHPDVPLPVGPTHPIEEPDDVPEPEHPLANGEEGALVEAEVEPYLGLDDFVQEMPGRATMTEASIRATEAALKQWLRQSGQGRLGYYPRAQWQEYFAQAMAAT